MDAPKSPPNLAQELLRIHRVITRGLTIVLAKGLEFQQGGFPNPNLRQGYADYTHCLTVTLKAHHLAEDEIGFPSLKEKFPQAPFERLSADHQQMETLLNPLMQASANITSEAGGADLTLLLDHLQRVSAIWTPHIQVEEENFTQEAVAAVMDSQEQGRLSVALIKHNQEHSKPASLILPFLLFNLNADDRALMAATAPSVVVKVLVPIVWKNKWARMKPFLLQ